MTQLEKGTVKILSGGNTYAVDEARVIFPSNESYNKAFLETRGYALPLSTLSPVTINFERGTISLCRFKGSIYEINERRRGKDIEYTYTCYSDAFKGEYTGFTPSSDEIIASTLVKDIITVMGLPSPECKDLDNTIILSYSRRDYCSRYLRDLSSKHNINFFWDEDSKLYAFKEVYDTYSTSLSDFIVREKEEDISGVRNSIRLFSDEYYYGGEDYWTEENITNWKYKNFSYQWPWNMSDWPTTVKSPSSCSISTVGSYSASFPLDTLSGYFSTERFVARSTIPSSPIPINKLKKIKFYIALKADTSYGANPDGSTIFVWDMSAEIHSLSSLPTEELKKQWTGYWLEKVWKRATQKLDKIPVLKNSIVWQPVTINIEGMKDEGIDPKSDYSVKHFDIHVDQIYTGELSGGPYTISLLIDGLTFIGEKDYYYSDTDSVSKYGARELIDPSKSDVSCHTDSEFEEAGKERLGDLVKPETSIKKLEFHGSISLYPGHAITLTFDDYTKEYYIQEVEDYFNGDDWYTGLKLSSSRIVIPKVHVIGKIKDLDTELRRLEILLLLNLQYLD